LAPNKRKMLEAARKYAQKGAQDRALKEYEQLLKLDPRDAKLRLEVGDAHRRWGQVEEAMAAYRRVAEQYTAEGFDARAVAVYKQIQSLDPTGHGAFEPLAELYQRMGLASEAISALQAAADAHAREGNKRHALDLLRRMVALDPTHTTNRIKVADLLRQEGLLDESAAEYESACTELERQGETEAMGRVLERLLELAPDRTDVLARFARNLLARGNADEAEAPARRARELDPQEIQHHELLADVYRAQKRDEKLVEVYRRIAELHRLRGDDGQARDIMQRFVPMEAFEAPAPALEESPFGAETLEFDDTGADRELLHDDAFLDDAGPITHRPAVKAAPPAVRSARPPPVSAPHPVSAPPPAARESSAEETVFELGAEAGSRILGDPEALLAEASVYLRYGKRMQAIENLQAILARSPHHRGALEKLGDAYADDGDAAGAVAAWLRAGEIARDEGDLEATSLLRDRVAALDAAAAATLDTGDEGDEVESDEEYIELPDEEELRRDEPARGDDLDASVDDIEIDLGGVGDDEALAPAPPVAAATGSGDTRFAAGSDAEEELEIELDLDEAESLGVGGAEPAASDPGSLSAPEQEPAPEGGSNPERISEDLEEAEFYLQQGLAEEASALFQRVLAGSPGHPLALLRLGELAAAVGEDPDAPGSAPRPPDHSLTPVAPSPARPMVEDTDPDPDGTWLQGDEDPFLDDEHAIDPDATSPPGAEPIDPHGESAHGMSLDSAAASPPGLDAREATPVEGPPGDFDLAAELSAALEAVVPEGKAGAAGDEGFQAVFGAFKRGVEASLGSEDHEAHYDLGIAYREMGLLDDAVAEFRSALHSPARRIDCLHMLGLCALEQGRSDEAVDLLAHALGAPDVGQEQELAIRFELGRAYAQSGELEKARSAWEKVAAADPEFCEVGELLAGLTPREAAPAVELESFGDLIAEAEGGDAREPAPEHESFDDLLEAARADLDAEDGASASERERPPAGKHPEPRAKARRRKISFV
jgi:tetratricopeptide (TPR) repeat protein